jgi:asparaginyl-tRNA synthetase
MSKSTSVKDALAAHGPQDAILVQGWVRTRRDAKGFSFIELNDGSCLRSLQVIAMPPCPNTRSRAEADHGRVRQRARPWSGPRTPPTRCRRRGTRSSSCARSRTCGRARICSARLPRAQPAGVRGAPVFPGTRLRLRAHADHHRQRLRGRGRAVPRDHADVGQPPRASRGRRWISRPDFFARSTYLTVSGQLEAETFACALGNIYTFGPTFRAENSNTSRHAAEFWMIEPEMAFCDLVGDMDAGRGVREVPHPRRAASLRG